MALLKFAKLGGSIAAHHSQQLLITITANPRSLTRNPKPTNTLYPYSMSLLRNLPPELVLQIIDVVCPDDLENFSSCCKTLHDLARDALLRHKEMKKIYSTVGCGPYWEPKIKRHSTAFPITILRAIIANNHYKFYPKTLEIDDRYRNQWQSTRIDPETKAKLVDLRKDILNLLATCPFLEDHEEFRTWRRNYQMDGIGVCLALAVILLPNITKIKICGEHIMLRELLDQVARYTAITPPSKSLPLSKLSHVDILGPNGGFDFGASLAVMPSLRSIYAYEIEEENFKWKFAPGISGITELTLGRSAICASSLSEILRGIKSLRKFRYSVNIAFSDWQRRKVIASLLENAKDSLEELSLFPDPALYWGMPEMDGIISSMGSLRAFSKLKNICLDVTALFPQASKRDGENYGTNLKGGSSPPEPLVHFLPASAESLTLRGYMSEKEGIQTFCDAPNFKGHQLPKLKEVGFDGPVPLGNEMQVACDKVGIKLIPHEETPSWTRHQVAQGAGLE